MALWNLTLFLRTSVPSEDGCTYLRMAEQFARGEWHEPLASVFPPGWPLFLAPWLWLGAASEWASVVLATSCVLLSLRPMAQCAALLVATPSQPAAAAPFAAMLLLATSPLLSRLAVEGYSEPLFLLCMAQGTLSLLRGRAWAVGAWAGAAFWVRPEGALLAPLLVMVQPTRRSAWRKALQASLLVLCSVLLQAVLRCGAGLGFDALPLLGFHATRDELSQRGAWFANLLAVPGPWLEGLGVSGLLALGAVGPRLWALRAAALAQLAVVLTFVVRRRFFVSCAVAVHGLAAVAIANWPARWRKGLLGLAVLHAVVGGWLGTMDQDRALDRELGRYFAGQLAAATGLQSDLPRVLYYAQRPLGEPRRWSAEQWLARAEQQRAEWLVLGKRNAQQARRAGTAAWGEFVPATLPEPLASACAQRELLVLTRRSAR